MGRRKDMYVDPFILGAVAGVIGTVIVFGILVAVVGRKSHEQK